MVNTGNIKLIHNSQISTYLWNNTVQKAVNGDVQNLCWYLDSIDDDWYGLVKDNYTAVMPVFIKRLFASKLAYVPKFSGPGGVFSILPINQSLINEFISELEKHVWLYKYQFNKYTQLKTIRKPKQKRLWFDIDLIQSYQKTKFHYTTLARNRIEYCSENNYSVVFGLALHDVTNFLKKNALNLAQADITIIQKLVSNAIRYRSGETIGLYDRHNSLSGIAFIIWAKNKIYLQFMVLCNEATKDGAAFMMLDNYFKEKAGKNLVFSVNTRFFYPGAKVLENLGMQKSYTSILRKRWLFRGK